jgi:hypothetical protein
MHPINPKKSVETTQVVPTLGINFLYSSYLVDTEAFD